MASPGSLLVELVLERGSLSAVDEEAPESELADDFVERSPADEELLERVAWGISISDAPEGGEGGGCALRPYPVAPMS